MDREQLLQNMNDAAKEDRERFFAVADTLHLQPKYREYVNSGELEEVKQYWRDMTALPEYPNIDFPIQLPEWFPKVRLTSSWKKDSYIAETLAEAVEYEKNIKLEEIL